MKNISQWFTHRYGIITPVILGSVLLFELLAVWESLSRPLWFDEAWRPDFINRNFSIPIEERESYAPISLGLYAFTKFALLFADNNFTHRLATYVALLVLPFMVYKFCTVYFDRRTAQVAVVITALCGFVLEFATQNKPYIADILCALALLTAHRSYLQDKLRLRYFILLSVGSLLISFTALFIVAILGIYILYGLYKRELKDKVNASIAWLLSVACVAIGHLLLFIRPQLTPSLYTYYGELYLNGDIPQILWSALRNILSMFDIVLLGQRITSPGLEPFPVFWTSTQIELYGRPVMGLVGFFGLMYLALFIYGLARLLRRKQYFLPMTLLLLYGMFFVTSILGQWPFGNSRTNLFAACIVLLVTCYGATGLAESGLKRYPKSALTLLFVLIILLFPYSTVVRAIKGPSTFSNDYGIASGLQPATLYVAKHSNPPDKVIVTYYSGPFGFDYFYNFSDYTEEYRNSHAKRVYMSNDRNRPFLRDNKPFSTKDASIWLIDGWLNDQEHIEYIEKQGYRLVYRHVESGIVTAKLEPIE